MTHFCSLHLNSNCCSNLTPILVFQQVMRHFGISTCIWSENPKKTNGKNTGGSTSDFKHRSSVEPHKNVLFRFWLTHLYWNWHDKVFHSNVCNPKLTVSLWCVQTWLCFSTFKPIRWTPWIPSFITTPNFRIFPEKIFWAPLCCPL